jgi:hypothetical protein
MPGRLILVSKQGTDQQSVAYIVAEEDSEKAVDLVRSKIAQPDDEVMSLAARISDELLSALSLSAGEIRGINATAPRQVTETATPATYSGPLRRSTDSQ